MNVTLQTGLGAAPLALKDVGQLAVYTNANELVALMWEREDGSLALTRIGEPDFDRLVKHMGLRTPGFSVKE